MLDFDDVRDMKQEREGLRRSDELFNRVVAKVDKHRRVVADKRAALEAQLTAAEEVLEREKESALALHAEATFEQAVAGGEAKGGLVGTWSEVEQAAAAVRGAGDELAAARRRAHERAEAECKQLDASKALYQVYCAATGMRWDEAAETVGGYVAVGDAVRAFDMAPPQGPDAASQMAVTTALWQEIEAACLPDGAAALPEGAAATSAAALPAALGAAECESSTGSGFASPQSAWEEAAGEGGGHP